MVEGFVRMEFLEFNIFVVCKVCLYNARGWLHGLHLNVLDNFLEIVILSASHLTLATPRGTDITMRWHFRWGIEISIFKVGVGLEVKGELLLPEFRIIAAVSFCWVLPRLCCIVMLIGVSRLLDNPSAHKWPAKVMVSGEVIKNIHPLAIYKSILLLWLVGLNYSSFHSYFLLIFGVEVFLFVIKVHFKLLLLVTIS